MKYLLDGEQTERLLFRKIDESDYGHWLPFFFDPKTHVHWTSPINVPDVECQNWYHKQRWRYQNDMGGMNAIIEKQSGKLIGHCGLLVQTVDQIAELEIGYSLLPQYWGNGYATESAKKCRDHAFENGLAETLISIISITNKPSENVALKNGMELDKTTVYHDNEVNIFRISLDNWRQLKSQA
jgi:RimJ/RimL family protein N-acetyltransferase